MQADGPSKIERKDGKSVRFYGVLFTAVPALLAGGLIWYGTTLTQGLGVILGILVAQSVRSNLKFTGSIEMDGRALRVQSLWTGKLQTHHELSSLEAKLVVEAGESRRLVPQIYKLRFATGGVALQTSSYEGAEQLVSSLLQAASPHVKFPVRLDGSALQQWTRHPESPDLGVAGGYRHLDNSLVSLFVYDNGVKNIPRGPEGAAIGEEFQRAIDDVQALCKKQRLAMQVGEREKRQIGKLTFLSANLVVGGRGEVAHSLLMITGWHHRFLKVRVTLPPGQQTASQAVDEIVAAFVRENQS